MKGIFVEGVRGAFIRVIRLIVYILIILTITFIVGFFSQKKASALVYKGLNQSLIDSPGNTRTGTLTPNQEAVIDFVYTRPNTSTNDLIGFRIHDFSLSPQNYNSPNTESTSCTGYTSNNAPSGYNETIQWSCSGNISNYQNLMPSDFDVYVYAFVFYDDNSSNFCYQSSEVKDTFLCPTVGGHSVTKIQFHFRANNVVNWYYRIQTSNNLAYYNYESTEIINSNGTIINQNTTIITQQQQQNDYVQNGSTTGAQNDSTNALSGLQQTFSQKMTGMNELTQMVFAPIQMMLTVSSGTCIPMEWDIPFVNTHVVIPCMSTIYNNYFGLFITMFSTVIMGIYAYRSVLKLVNCIKDILDAENDKLEVLEL